MSITLNIYDDGEIFVPCPFKKKIIWKKKSHSLIHKIQLT